MMVVYIIGAVCREYLVCNHCYEVILTLLPDHSVVFGFDSPAYLTCINSDVQRCNTTCEQATLTHMDDVTTLSLDLQSCTLIDPCPELTVFYGKLVGGEHECSYRIRDEDLCNGAGFEQAR